jgi:hypothetical protein
MADDRYLEADGTRREVDPGASRRDEGAAVGVGASVQVGGGHLVETTLKSDRRQIDDQPARLSFCDRGHHASQSPWRRRRGLPLRQHRDVLNHQAPAFGNDERGLGVRQQEFKSLLERIVERIQPGAIDVADRNRHASRRLVRRVLRCGRLLRSGLLPGGQHVGTSVGRGGRERCGEDQRGEQTGKDPSHRNLRWHRVRARGGAMLSHRRGRVAALRSIAPRRWLSFGFRGPHLRCASRSVAAEHTGLRPRSRARIPSTDRAQFTVRPNVAAAPSWKYPWVSGRRRRTGPQMGETK